MNSRSSSNNLFFIEYNVGEIIESSSGDILKVMKNMTSQFSCLRCYYFSSNFCDYHFKESKVLKPNCQNYSRIDGIDVIFMKIKRTLFIDRYLHENRGGRKYTL